MLTGNDPLQKRPLPPDRRQKRLSFARAAGSFVPKIANKSFEKFGFHTAEILMQWSLIVGAEVAAITRPEKIRWPRLPSGAAEDAARPGGTLVIRVEPARALDIEYRGAEIIDRINRYFGYRAVETIKLIQAPLPGSEPDQRPGREKPTPETAARCAQAAAGVTIALPDDGGLGTALRQLWSSVSRLR